MDISALAEDLVRNGLRLAFGIPGGGSSLHLIDEMMRRGIAFITTGHETTAALMAGAVSRLSGSPSAAISIKGPGFMNLQPGLLSNAYEGYPMLSIAEAYPENASTTRRHKWLAHQQILSTFAKGYSCWDGGPDLVSRCWIKSNQEFPGPVHVELAEGTGLQAENKEAVADDPSEILSQVRRAERPVLILGSLALRSRWRMCLERLQLPIFTTVAGKGAISEFSNFAAGVYTGEGKSLSPESRLLSKADLIVTIGVRSGEVLDTCSPQAACIHLDIHTVRSGGVFPPETSKLISYFSDCQFAELLHLLEQKSWGEKEILTALKDMESALCSREWSPALIYRMVSEILPDAVHVLDTGNFTVVGEHILRVSSERQILGSPNGRYMGMGIGYALGAAIASVDRPVVLWIGDGGIRVFLSELSLAVDHNLKLLVIVMSDGYFGSIRGRAIANGWSTIPLRMQGRDLRCIAEAMGLDTLVTNDVDELVEALKTWQTTSRPALIRCDFDADQYTRTAELLR